MNKFPPDQTIKNVKRKQIKAPQQKTPRAKFDDPSFPESNGDLGIQKISGTDIPRMVKAPTRTVDNTSHAMSNVMKKAGMLRK